MTKIVSNGSQPQPNPEPVALKASTALTAVKRFNESLNHTLTRPDDYRAQQVSGSKILLRAFCGGGDTIIKRAFDSTRTPGERITAAVVSPAAIVSTCVGTAGVLCFSWGFWIANDYFHTSATYPSKKQTRNRVHAIHDQVRRLEADLKPYFRRGKPVDSVRYDLPRIADELDRAQALLGSPAAESLGVTRLTQVPRKFLAAVDSVQVKDSAARRA